MIRSNKTTSSEAWNVIVARTLAEIEDYRPMWEQMQHAQPAPDPGGDIDHYLATIQSWPDTVWPHVMLLFHNNHLEAMVIGYITSKRINCDYGYKTLFKPTLRCLTVVYGGLIGNLAEEVSSMIARKLIDMLSRGEVDALFIRNLRIDTPLYPKMRKMPNFLCRGHFPKVEPHWKMSIPESVESFLSTRTSSYRKHFKRCIKRIEKAYPNRFRVLTFTRESELDEALKMVTEISVTTYQHAMGRDFLGSTQQRYLIRNAAKLGRLHVQVLLINEEPCAYQIWHHYGRICFGGGQGFNPIWKKFRVGTVLFLKALEEFCSDSTVDFLDYGFGEAEYKRSYCDEKWFEASVYVFALRLYPVYVNLLNSLTRCISLGSVFIVRKLGFLNRIKHHWRTRIQDKK